MKRRLVLQALAPAAGGVLATLGGGEPAFAADYPARAVRVVVPFTAGGPPDLIARVLGEAFDKAGGAPFVVENVGGAGGTVGTQRVADAPADGYTLLLGTSSALVVAPHLYKARYDPMTSFEPIGKIATASLVLLVKADSGFGRFDQFVARGRQRPSRLTFGTPGIGSTPHLAGELMMKELAMTALHVPFKGAAPMYTSLLSGDVDFVLDNPSGAVPMVKASKAVALAVTSRVRERDLPEVPTLRELGLRDFEAMGWYALLAPKGTPPAVVQWLRQRLVETLKKPEVMQTLTRAGYFVVDRPDDLRHDLAAEYERWGGLVKQLNLRVEN